MYRPFQRILRVCLVQKRVMHFRVEFSPYRGYKLVPFGSVSTTGVYSLEFVGTAYLDAETDLDKGARVFEVSPLSDLSRECKVIMFDAGTCLRRTG